MLVAGSAGAKQLRRGHDHGNVVASFVRERAADASASDVEVVWEETELLGPCPGGSRLRPAAKGVGGVLLDSAAACEKECARSSTCVTWQFREGDWCKLGGDVRVGMERDAGSKRKGALRWHFNSARDRIHWSRA